jgi:Xaa-Pro aminopeptidase
MSYERRRADALKRLPDGLDALLVTTPANVRYLTGFTGSNGQLVLASDLVFFTDGRYTEQAAEEVPGIDRAIYSAGTKLSELLAKAVADRGTTKLGLEGNNVTLAMRDRLAKGLDGIELVPTTEIVEHVRMRKDGAEIDAVRRAQKVAEGALVSTLEPWSGGTEAELALAIEWAMRTNGAQEVAFETIVATGAHSALPHASPRNEPAATDGVLLIDMGAKAGGYCSDMTRTYLGPKASDEMRKIHASVLAALEAACDAIRPGVRCADVDKAARDALDRDGYGELFVHSTGHGVGLEIHEEPSFGPTSEQTLEPGMVVTVEPGVYVPGTGGVRIEDLLVVTEDGAENLTSLPRGPELP